MAVTTENITETLKSVVEILQIDDEEKIDLAVDILSLVINYIGAENVMLSIENGLENIIEGISELVTGDSSELSLEERSERLVATRETLDKLFKKMAVIQAV